MLEVANIRRAILPLVVAETVRFTDAVVSDVSVSVCKDFRAFSMFQIVLPLTFVSVSVFPLVDSVPMAFSVFPLPDIRVATGPLPDSETLLDSLLPLTIVYLVIGPGKDAFAVCFVVQVLSDVP